MGGVVFCVVASYLISKYYIEIAEGKMFIWIIIALIVGVLVLPVI
jgi:phosphatidate cytidylyltransferase